MGDFKLSAQLQGHEDDVRSVAFPDPSFALSASRDATVRVWKLLSNSPPTYDCTLASHGTAFVNSVAYVPPSQNYSDGLIVAGGKDTIIEVRQPSKAPQDNAEALLLGHQSNVCALDVSEDGRTIVSGSWDTEARIWQIGNWEASTVLRGHTASVWAVLAYDRKIVITGCADKQIRFFTTDGKLLRSIPGGPDVVRALCRLPKDHPSGAQFASAGNDGVIRLWTIEGQQVAELHGHENFIYSLAVLPTGELVSSSEDRTVRIWKGDQCVQTITHPAISVWSVAVCQQNGDIVSGASDRIVRIFSRAQDRQADANAIKEFEDAVKGSAIPQQQVGNINKEQLPGPEFLTSKSGTKEGQVQMIREANGNVSAYQWSTAASQWLNVGTVVDAVGSSGKKISYNGKDYDYVFDVDIEDGKPPLKLPYNLSQNPYETARKFIEDNKLPISYLDQVTNFIVTNTQGATLGQSSGPTQAPASDPWGTESRYRPGEVGAAAPQNVPAASKPKVLPQTSYLKIDTANLAVIEKKIKEVNQQLLDEGLKDISLNPSDISALSATCRQLQQASSAKSTSTAGIDVAVKIATTWPVDKRLPGLDLLRLLAAASATTATHTSSGDTTIVHLLRDAGTFAPDSPANNVMLGVRVFANMFNTEEGRTIMDGTFEVIHPLIQPFIRSHLSNRNLIVAITTLYINFAVLLTSPSHNADRALTLLDDLTNLINTVEEPEALYRALVGAGTLLALGEDFRAAAQEVFDFEKALARAEQVSKEERVKSVVTEMRDELASVAAAAAAA
ncbi:polyubiquitin binding protein-like protein [Macrophomina phaseolina]|uniref:Polyubiquitin binding protein-like protein n=1 Tax=Macrophomina phaseolina TaxID=35725 RepID=A0ABQ8G3S9_9PEZI|nr:polyubiquitin binding protein-like protein [Macrophomina phaseolina]